MWNTTALTSTAVSASTAQVTGNWSAIDSWFDTEHYNLSSGASGYHRPGEVSVLYVGSNDQISALSNPGTGAIVYNTSKGELETRRWITASAGLEWTSLSYYEYPRVQKTTYPATYLAGSVYSLRWTTTNYTYDPLNMYTPSTSAFTIPESGYYLVEIAGTSHVPTDKYCFLSIQKNATEVETPYFHECGIVAYSDIFSCVRADTLKVGFCHNNTEAGISPEFLLSITKVS